MRFLFIDAEQSEAAGVRFDAEQSHYLARVLRASVGDRIDTVPRRRGQIWTLELVSFDRNGVWGRLVEARPLPETPSPRLELHLACLKTDRMEWALQKATELGVDRFVPLAAARSVKVPSRDPLGRLAKIAEAACQQSGRMRPPELEIPARPAAALEAALARGCRAVVLHPEPTAPRLGALVFGDDRDVACFVGPEGGFSEDELELTRRPGAETARLGGNILRAETAAVAASALLLAAMGRL